MAAVSLSRADSRLDEDPPGSRHLRFIAAIVGAVLPRHYWSRFDTVLPVSRAALGSSIATIFLAALIFIPASLRYVEGHRQDCDKTAHPQAPRAAYPPVRDVARTSAKCLQEQAQPCDNFPSTVSSCGSTTTSTSLKRS